MDSILNVVVDLLTEATAATRTAADILRRLPVDGATRDHVTLQLRSAADNVVAALDLVDEGRLQEAERVAFMAKAAADAAVRRVWFR